MTPLSKKPFPLICIYLRLHLMVNLSAHTRYQSNSSLGRMSPQEGCLPLPGEQQPIIPHGKVCSPYFPGPGSKPTLLVMSSLIWSL